MGYFGLTVVIAAWLLFFLLCIISNELDQVVPLACMVFLFAGGGTILSYIIPCPSYEIQTKVVNIASSVESDGVITVLTDKGDSYKFTSLADLYVKEAKQLVVNDKAKNVYGVELSVRGVNREKSIELVKKNKQNDYSIYLDRTNFLITSYSNKNRRKLNEY